MLQIHRISNLFPYRSAVMKAFCSSSESVLYRWSTMASIFPPRHDHTVFLEQGVADNGQSTLLAMGGSFGFDVSSRWDVWRLRQGAKSWMGPLKISKCDVSPRAGFGAAAIIGEHGLVYVLTNGYDSGAAGGGNVENLIALVTNGADAGGPSFAVLSGDCAPRSGGTLTTVDGGQSALLFGGYGDDGSLCDVHKVTLGPSSLTSSPKIDMQEVEVATDHRPDPRCAHATAPLVGGGLIVFGGYGSSGPMNDLWELRHEGAGSKRMYWAQVRDASGHPPRPRSGHSFTALGNQANEFVCFGGVGPDGEGFADVHIYDSVRRHWRIVEDIEGVPPTARYNHRAAFGEWCGEASLLITGGFTCDDGFGLGRAVGECFALKIGG